MKAPETFGMRYLRRLQLARPTTGMWANLGLRLVQAEIGSAVVEGEVSGDTHGSPAAGGAGVHNGVVATVADCAIACAGTTLMSEGEQAATVELSVEFFKPARPGKILARAEVRHRTDQLVFCRSIVEQDGEAVAECRGTIALVPA
jgi:uncharacterized protein (TIGR00369 family)